MLSRILYDWIMIKEIHNELLELLENIIDEAIF